MLSTAVAGGNPPDMADIAQPGLVKQFVGKGALKPISYARRRCCAELRAGLDQASGTFNGKLYGLVFKASNKSTVWYNVPAFKAAGVKAPKTWPQLLAAAKTIKASGAPPYSIGGADGWTLTDLFENIYLRQAGPAKYDLLSAHKIKWTDPSVTGRARRRWRTIIGNSANMAGGTAGALQTDFPTSVSNVFQTPAEGGDGVRGRLRRRRDRHAMKAKPGTGYSVVRRSRRSASSAQRRS